MKSRVAFGVSLGLPEEQAETLARLKSPEAVQDFITDLRINAEAGGDTCLPVTETLRQRHAHCIEGAFVAACALWMAGEKPLLMDMQAASGDHDHVIALFQRNGCWGAISKSNHVWVRWRDPIYRSLRELAISYFNEYCLGDRKTLRNYSASIDLRRFPPGEWVAGRESCWEVGAALDDARHYPLLSPGQERSLKSRDRMEMRADKIVEYR